METMWSEAKSILQKKLSPNNFGIWIAPIDCVAVESDHLELKTPDQHFSNHLKDHFLKEIQEAVEKAFGKSMQIQFSNSRSLKKKSKPVEKETPIRISGRPTDKRFDNFVVGACNQFAHAAAQAVAESPGENQYNPLFIYGSTGLGKTHLLHAIANQVQDEQPNLNILYITAEQFTNEVVSSIRYNKMPDFHTKYRNNCHFLLIDDIQFLSKKDRTQEILFHTFEWLKERGRQIVFTADVLPKEIDYMEPRLRTRFESGMLADTQAPDLETMTAILHQKSDLMNLKLDTEVAMYIATGVRGNIRELEGILNRLEAICRFHQSSPKLSFVRHHFHSLLNHDEGKNIQPHVIVQSVATTFGISSTDITGKKRNKNIVKPRHIGMWLIRHHTDLSFPDIGKVFGGRDHASVQYAVSKIKKLLETDPDLKNTIRLIERNLLNK